MRFQKMYVCRLCKKTYAGAGTDKTQVEAITLLRELLAETAIHFCSMDSGTLGVGEFVGLVDAEAALAKQEAE